MSFYDYLVEKGDSLQIDFQNRVPKASVLNRNVPYLELNYDHYSRNRLSAGDKPADYIEKYFHPELDLNFAKGNFREQLSKTKSKNYILAKQFFEQEKKLLDSLKANQAISAKSYDFYYDRLKYVGYQLDVLEDKLPLPAIKDIIMEMSNSNFNEINLYKNSFINAVAEQLYVTKARKIDTGNSIIYDYRQAYDMINNSDLLDVTYKNSLLLQQIELIVENFSATDIKVYYDKFNQDVKDTTLLNYVKSQYTWAVSNSAQETKSVYLLTANKEEVTFEDIKKRYSGKVLYVDFWASWCGPCREVMPQSIELKESLKDSNVVFVYLSIDKSFDAWQKASVKEGLNEHRENYLILNTTTSEFIKKQNLSTIPRYMIFDKGGKLAYAKAPSVTSKELKAILIELAEM